MTLISCSCRCRTNLCFLFSITHDPFSLLHFYSHSLQSISLSSLHPSSFYTFYPLPSAFFLSLTSLSFTSQRIKPLLLSQPESAGIYYSAVEEICHLGADVTSDLVGREGCRRGALEEGRCAAVPRWDKVGIVMGVTYGESLPSPLSYLHTHKHTAVEP